MGAFISRSRGGSWSSGFWSGSMGTMLGAVDTGQNYYMNVAKNATISGTISQITGGKFANGAILGAFRYMFNDAMEHGKKLIWATIKDYNEATIYQVITEQQRMMVISKSTFEKEINFGEWKFKNDSAFRTARDNLSAELYALSQDMGKGFVSGGFNFEQLVADTVSRQIGSLHRMDTMLSSDWTVGYWSTPPNHGNPSSIHVIGLYKYE